MSFNPATPLESAPLVGTVVSVDDVDRSCVVQVQSDVLDDVTWYGVDPVEGEIVYLTATGGRMIAVVPRPDDSDVFVNIAGDTMTGNLTVPTGTASGHAVNKGQMDAADAALGAKTINGGNGLYGSGALSTNPTLHVGAGHQLAVGADAIGLITGCQSISNWDDALYNGFYMGAPGTANSPSSTKTGWWYGWTVNHNSAWATQFAMPFAQNGIDGAALAARHKENGVWGTWYRVVNYSALSWDTLDNFIFIRHGGNSADVNTSATVRWAIGNKKDSATSAASANDEFRVQAYNTSGSYTSKPIYIRASDGIVRMPNNSGAVPTLRSGGTIEEDVASNAGSVVDMIADALEGLGLVNTAARATPLRQELRQILGIVPAPPDDTVEEPPPAPVEPEVPIEETLTPPEEA